MAGELTKSDKELVVAVGERGLGELIKPIVREIPLFDAYVAHSTRKGCRERLEKLSPGDELGLRREESEFDVNDIAVLDPKGETIGNVPEKDAPVFARLMDAGKILKARVLSVERRGSVPLVRITILLVDL